MSLPRDPLQPVPAETARVAHATFPTGNVYMRIRDELGTLFDDERFTTVNAREGQPALHPRQLALVSVMQFAKNLTDRQAADAVRRRLDGKYARATRGRTVGVGSRQTLPQVSVPDLSPILACVAGNGGVRSRG
jgi:hypothetical protein